MPLDFRGQLALVLAYIILGDKEMKNILLSLIVIITPKCTLMLYNFLQFLTTFHNLLQLFAF